METNYVTIPVEEYKKLVESAREGEILTAIVFDRAESYMNLENPKLRMIRKMFVGKESEEK